MSLLKVVTIKPSNGFSELSQDTDNNPVITITTKRAMVIPVFFLLAMLFFIQSSVMVIGFSFLGLF
jgi:hypothetical protein